MVCSLEQFSPCSWDLSGATVLCSRLGHACLPGAASSSPQAHPEEAQPGAVLQQHSLHTPATPQSRIKPPNTSMGILVGPASASMEPTHETGRHSLTGSEFPAWLRCFGHADWQQTRSPVCLLSSLPHLHTSPPVL